MIQTRMLLLRPTLGAYSPYIVGSFGIVIALALCGITNEKPKPTEVKDIQAMDKATDWSFMIKT